MSADDKVFGRSMTAEEAEAVRAQYESDGWRLFYVSRELHPVIAEVLAEFAWLDANPEHIRIKQNEYDLNVQEAALLIRKAMRLGKEGV